MLAESGGRWSRGDRFGPQPRPARPRKAPGSRWCERGSCAINQTTSARIRGDAADGRGRQKSSRPAWAAQPPRGHSGRRKPPPWASSSASGRLRRTHTKFFDLVEERPRDEAVALMTDYSIATTKVIVSCSGDRMSTGHSARAPRCCARSCSVTCPREAFDSRHAIVDSHAPRSAPRRRSSRRASPSGSHLRPRRPARYLCARAPLHGDKAERYSRRGSTAAPLHTPVRAPRSIS